MLQCGDAASCNTATLQAESMQIIAGCQQTCQLAAVEVNHHFSHVQIQLGKWHECQIYIKVLKDAQC